VLHVCDFFFQVKSREVLVFITCIEWEREREREKEKKKRTKCHRPFQGLRLNGISHPASSFLSSVCSLHRNTDHDPNTRRARVRRGGGLYLYRRVNFTRHYPDVDFFVLSGRGTTWKPLEDLFSMDDGLAVRRESPMERVQRRCNAMYREASDWWGPRTFLILYVNYRLI